MKTIVCCCGVLCCSVFYFLCVFVLSRWFWFIVHTGATNRLFDARKSAIMITTSAIAVKSNHNQFESIQRRSLAGLASFEIFHFAVTATRVFHLPMMKMRAQNICDNAKHLKQYVCTENGNALHVASKRNDTTPLNRLYA